jgi:hypothetical protein
MNLKIAAMILFWFGIYAEFLVLASFSILYYRYGTFEGNTLQQIFSGGFLNIIYFIYRQYGHGVHILSGYWLSKGRKKGIILGGSLCLYEIVSFLVPVIDPNLFTPYGMGVRILFAFVIFLLVIRRKELERLKSENWRPWKNPFAN